MTSTFYRDLPVFESFAAGIDTKAHHDLPDDWVVVLTDVVASTQAIEHGQYKSVNSIGVACIVAVINVDRSIEIPYVFGGDGCTAAVPPSMVEGVRNALLGCQEMARTAFGLDLRCSLIPARDLKQNDHWLRVGKMRVSKHMLQATFSGRGWELAEWLIKAKAEQRYVLQAPAGEAPEVDLSGYECRWQGVPPQRGRILCAVVKCLDADTAKRVTAYREVIETIDRTFSGQDGGRPDPNALTLSLNPRTAWQETLVRTTGRGLGARLARFARAYFEVLLGSLLMKISARAPGADWSTYRQIVVQNTDRRKFDGVLRVVLDCTDQEATAFEHYLAERKAAGQLVYGLHKSRYALITCMIFAYRDAHYHFLDGADGGYAMAAKALKRQLADMGLLPPLPVREQKAG